MTDHKQNAGPYPHGTFASAAWALGTATRALGRQLELAIRAFGREVAAPLLPAARAFVCRRYGHEYPVYPVTVEQFDALMEHPKMRTVILSQTCARCGCKRYHTGSDCA
jgi:hypothetical protein